jgi:hypothetical protein
VRASNRGKHATSLSQRRRFWRHDRPRHEREKPSAKPQGAPRCVVTAAYDDLLSLAYLKLASRFEDLPTIEALARHGHSSTSSQYTAALTGTALSLRWLHPPSSDRLRLLGGPRGSIDDRPLKLTSSEAKRHDDDGSFGGLWASRHHDDRGFIRRASTFTRPQGIVRLTREMAMSGLTSQISMSV